MKTLISFFTQQISKIHCKAAANPLTSTKTSNQHDLCAKTKFYWLMINNSTLKQSKSWCFMDVRSKQKISVATLTTEDRPSKLLKRMLKRTTIAFVITTWSSSIVTCHLWMVTKPLVQSENTFMSKTWSNLLSQQLRDMWMTVTSKRG